MKTLRILAVTLALAMPSFAFAFTAQSGESLSVSIPVADDLYAAGSRVSVQSPVTGDLLVAGTDVSSEGSVSESVMTAGANLDVGGRIGDDLRAAGGNIRIHSSIVGDAVVAGGNVDIQKDTTVGKDLVVMAGNVYIDGAINGRAQITAGKVYLNGNLSGDATIKAREIIVGSGAKIGGNLVYESEKANPSLESIVSGTKQFTQSSLSAKKFRTKILKFAIVYVLLKILFLTIFGWIIYTFMEKYAHETSDILKKSPWQSLFTGISFFVLVPIIALILALTIIGIPIAALLIVILVFIFLLYELIGTIIWTSWTLDRYMKGKKSLWWHKLLVIFGFAFAFGVISGIDIIPAWMAIGALLTRHWRLIESIRK